MDGRSRQRIRSALTCNCQTQIEAIFEVKIHRDGHIGPNKYNMTLRFFVMKVRLPTGKQQTQF